VRFLWRLDFKRLRRLCLFIFRRRFFFRLPMDQVLALGGGRFWRLEVGGGALEGRRGNLSSRKNDA
jgi:hypothetical protein